jgi:Fe-S-cluster containining protein
MNTFTDTVKIPAVDCSKCPGRCCHFAKSVLTVPVFQKTALQMLINEFPYKFNQETGVCEMLVNNRCSVYNNRPGICNSETVYNAVYKGVVTPGQYQKLVETSCHLLNLL